MDMVERYIAAVQRELPEAKRNDIGRELKSNILDQLEALEAQQQSLHQEDVARVLKALGRPREVAVAYNPPQPLISASLMRLYANTLYMVLGVLLVISVIEVTGAWLDGQIGGVTHFIFGIASSFLNSAYFAFTVITVAFMVMTRSNSQHSPKPKAQCDWSPERLPAVQQSWQHIRLDSIFTDLATLLFLVMVIWYPLWSNRSDSAFTAEALQILTWFSPVIIIAILASLWQLRVRLWSRAMLTLNIAISFAFFAVALWLSQIEVVQFSAEAMQNRLGVAFAEHSVRIILYSIALISGYEIVRDIRRLF